MRLLDKIVTVTLKLDYTPKYPKVSKKNFRAWNEKMFSKYNNERVYKHPNPLIRYIEKRRVECILEGLSPIKASDRILAAGCGEGFIEKYIEKGHLTMVDLSTEAISKAKKNFKRRKNVEFFIADLEKMPFEPRTFNKIECSEVIEHVYSPETLLTELKKALTDDGLLVISFPNEPLINYLKKILIRMGVFALFFPNIPKDMTEEWHLHVLDLKMFKTMCEGEWKLCSIRGVPFGFLPIRYVVKCEKL